MEGTAYEGGLPMMAKLMKKALACAMSVALAAASVPAAAFLAAWAPAVALAATSETATTKYVKMTYTDGSTSKTIYADTLEDICSTDGITYTLPDEDKYGDTVTITLQGNITTSSMFLVMTDVTLDLNGFKIDAAVSGSHSGDYALFSIDDHMDSTGSSADGAGKLTTQDTSSAKTGRISTNGYEYIFATRGSSASYTPELMVKNGEYVITDVSTASAAFFVVNNREYGEVTLESGTFVNCNSTSSTSNLRGPGVVRNKGTATIKGGTFAGACPSKGEGTIHSESGSTLTIQGDPLVYGRWGSMVLEGTTATIASSGTYAAGKTVSIDASNAIKIEDDTTITSTVALLVYNGSTVTIGGNAGAGQAPSNTNGPTFSGDTSLILGATGATFDTSRLHLHAGTLDGVIDLENLDTTSGGFTVYETSGNTTYYEVGTAASTGTLAARHLNQGFTLNNGIIKQELSADDVYFANDAGQPVAASALNLVYNGSAHTPSMIVSPNSIPLTENRDYVLTYDNNVNAGEDTATVTVTPTASSNYSGSVTKTFTIKPKTLVTRTASGGNTVVTITPSTLPYCQVIDSSGITRAYFDPTVTVAVDGVTIADTNYTLETSVDAATYKGTVTVKGQGNYDGEAEGTCTVVEGVRVAFLDGTDNSVITYRAAFPYTTQNPAAGSVEPPDPPVHAGYAFAGWEGNYTQVTEDSIVTARYTADPTGSGIIVSFVDPRDNNKIVKSEAVAVGGSATAPDGPVHEGYTFVGWEGTYQNVPGSSKLIQVFARYMAAGGHRVTFVDSLGGEIIKVDTVQDGDDAVPPTSAEMPTHLGHKFSGWDKAYTSIHEDTTVTTLYTDCQTYTVTFIDSMNNNAVLAEVQVNEGEAATAPTVPNYTGYDFAGWDRAFTNVTANITVTTKWEKQPDPAKPNAGDMAVLVEEEQPDGTIRYRLLDGDGKPATGWLLVGGQWYIADEDGYPRTGATNFGSTTYMLDSNGVLQVGWIYVKETGDWLWANPGTTGAYGAVVKGEWIWDGSGWYLASATGPIRTGWVEDERTGLRYHLNDGTNGTVGKMDANRWILRGDGWYWLASGGNVTTGWQWAGDAWYYLEPELGEDYGKMKTGWVWDNGYWYFLIRESGAMASDAWVLDNGLWYLVARNGTMQTGWKYVNGAWYYLGSDGVLYQNARTPDGYWVGNSGAWIF